MSHPLHIVRKVYLRQNPVHPYIRENDSTDYLADLIIRDVTSDGLAIGWIIYVGPGPSLFSVEPATAVEGLGS